MVDWTSPSQIAYDTAAFSKMMHVFSAIFLWEFIISLDFDWSFISGKRKFNWPMIPYMLGRYSGLMMVISMLVLVNNPQKKDCLILYRVPSIGTVFSSTFAATNLATRAMIIWDLNLICVIPLSILLIVQIGIALPCGIIVNVTWDPSLGCTETRIRTGLIAASYIWVIVVDFAGLSFCIARLMWPMRLRSRLSSFLFKDGMIYFLSVTLINIPTAAVSIRQTNPAIEAIMVIPCGAIATIAASRAVRNLSNFYQEPGGPAVYMTTTHHRGPLEFQRRMGEITGTGISATLDNPPLNKGSMPSDGIRVQMHTFSVTDGRQYEASQKPDTLTIAESEGEDASTRSQVEAQV